MKPEDLKKIVKEKYGKIAEESRTGQQSCCGSACCGDNSTYTVFSESYDGKEGYLADADMSLGCGIPTDYAGIKKGDNVLDLGSGAGNDCFVARSITGETGRVTGIDMTEQMVLKARENVRKSGYSNVEFVHGDIENMPFEDCIFDVVISNCVLNLVPDKSKAFSEIYRVLKHGGHFCVSDVVLKGNMPEKVKKDAELYAGCVSGASEMDEYLNIIGKSGFVNIRVHKQKEIKLPDSLLSGLNDLSELKSCESIKPGIFSITISASKP